MKLNIIPCIIAFAVSALLAFGFYSWCRDVDMRLLVTIVGGIGLLLTIGTAVGATFERSRTSINIKVASSTFSGIFLIENIVFCRAGGFSLSLYIILNGLLLLAWLSVVYGIYKASK